MTPNELRKMSALERRVKTLEKEVDDKSRQIFRLLEKQTDLRCVITKLSSAIAHLNDASGGPL